MEQRLIDANALKEMLIELLEDIKRNPRMDGYEMCIIASCATLCQMIDDAPSIWAGDAIDLSLKLLDEHERGMLFEYRNLGCTIDHLRSLVQAEQDGRIIILPPPAKEGDEAPDCFKSCTGIWCHGYEGFGDEDHRYHCKKCWYFEGFEGEADAELKGGDFG